MTTFNTCTPFLDITNLPLIPDSSPLNPPPIIFTNPSNQAYNAFWPFEPIIEEFPPVPNAPQSTSIKQPSNQIQEGPRTGLTLKFLADIPSPPQFTPTPIPSFQSNLTLHSPNPPPKRKHPDTYACDKCTKLMFAETMNETFFKMQILSAGDKS